MALPLIKRIRPNICAQPQYWFSSYFTTARIVMNNKSATVDETLAKNPFYEKYASKITTLQQNDPQKLAEKLDKLTSGSKPSKSSNLPSGSKFSSVSASSKQVDESVSQGSKGRYMQSQTKKLDAIMKTELLVDKSYEEIKIIWHEYFKHKDSVSGVLSDIIYNQLHSRAMEYPTFLFPLPRDEGYEFLVCQFAGNEAHFTSLINFQTYGENAPECLALVFYPDLAQEKKIVLLRGDYDKNILTPQEAQCLVNQVMLYYAQPTERKIQLVEQFNKNPDVFQHMDLVQELENIKLD